MRSVLSCSHANVHAYYGLSAKIIHGAKHDELQTRLFQFCFPSELFRKQTFYTNKILNFSYRFTDNYLVNL